jgi:peptidoglycan/LPS O-acetylase OafA/YrhL
MSEKGYFPNLNGLRAIGAFIVLFSHFYFFRMLMGYQETQWFPVPGKVGVALFFALSGFLITSLLFRELEKTHTIRLKDFYIRRMLRIWPLYYIILLLGFFVMNRIGIFKVPVLSDKMYHDISWWNILNIVLIIPNFTHYYVPYTDQRWSIIDEEMFYLIQPALLRIFRKKSVLVICRFFIRAIQGFRLCLRVRQTYLARSGESRVKPARIPGMYRDRMYIQHAVLQTGEPHQKMAVLQMDPIGCGGHYPCALRHLLLCAA